MYRTKSRAMYKKIFKRPSNTGDVSVLNTNLFDLNTDFIYSPALIFHTFPPKNGDPISAIVTLVMFYASMIDKLFPLEIVVELFLRYHAKLKSYPILMNFQNNEYTMENVHSISGIWHCHFTILNKTKQLRYNFVINFEG